MPLIYKHTLISCLINTIISLAFFLVIFSGDSSFVLGNLSKLTLDFLPQSFFVGLFSALPPSLLTLKDLKSGKTMPVNGIKMPLPDNLVLRIILLTLFSLVVFGGGALLFFHLTNPTTIDFSTAMVVKALFAILLSVVITPISVIATLQSSGKISVD